MKNGTIVILEGANVSETAKALVVRLIELGHNAELVDEPIAKTLGGAKPAMVAAQLLARNGVVVIVTAPKMRAPAESLAIAIDANDTPDFAAEKILDQLAETGIVTLEAGDYSPEDEERIRQRLSQLGYIE